MQNFNQSQLTDSMQGDPIEYLEFFRASSLSTGIYHLDTGSVDHQNPHDEDEIYYVLAGDASFTSGAKTILIKQGDILFVASAEKHKFHDITQDLTLLVFFTATK